MNKGFFAVVLLAAVSCALAVFQSESHLHSRFAENLVFGLENETVQFWRTTLENESDQTVSQALLVSAALPGATSESVKQFVNQSLFFNWQSIQNRFSHIRFFAVALAPDSYDHALSAPRQELSLSWLNENSTAVIIHSSSGVFASYAFTGGVFRNQAVLAEIQSGLTTGFFLFPIGFEQTVVVP